MPAKVELSVEQRKEVAELLSEAAFHRAAMWDALRGLEHVVECEVESDNEVGDNLAADCATPAVEYPEVDDDAVNAFLGSLEGAR